MASNRIRDRRPPRNFLDFADRYFDRASRSWHSLLRLLVFLTGFTLLAIGATLALAGLADALKVAAAAITMSGAMCIWIVAYIRRAGGQK